VLLSPGYDAERALLRAVIDASGRDDHEAITGEALQWRSYLEARLLSAYRDLDTREQKSLRTMANAMLRARHGTADGG
jgi:hypothetical protein